MRYRAANGNSPFLAAALLALAASLASHHATVGQSWRDLVGYTELQLRVDDGLPTGAGGAVSQVEATVNQAGAYFVDATLQTFNGSLDPLGLPVVFTDGSNGAMHGTSSHTGSVGNRFYGDADSVAPGANNVVIYEVNHWLSSILKYGSAANPVPQNYRVQNHSWIGTTAPGNPSPPPYTEDAQNIDVLARYDYLIERSNSGSGMTAVVGLNNNTAQLPYLMTHSYNAIAVGRSDGTHSSGLTLEPDGTPPNSSYGPGRSKPDIVAPLSSTSNATGAVSSAAAFLYEAVGGSDSVPNEVIKSLLLAGATKSEFPTWSRSSVRPLDDTFGAGELNVYSSYLMAIGGRQAGSQSVMAAPVGDFGWDYGDFRNNSTVDDIFYRFEIPAGSVAEELSIALSWNAEVIDTNGSASMFSPSVSLQNLDLQFYSSKLAPLGSLMDQSVSTVDNVEHLYFTNLASGVYTLKVSGAADWDYGIAWRTKTRSMSPGADFNEDGAVDGGDFLVWQQHLNTLVGANRWMGDADGDGDVDVDDLAVWKSSVRTAALSAASTEPVAVPEATALVLTAGWGACQFLQARRRVRDAAV